MNIFRHHHHRLAALALALSGLLLAGCSSDSGARTSTAGTPRIDANGQVKFADQKSGTPQAGQTLFTSAEQAAGEFKDAVAVRDRQTLAAMFGPDGKQLIFSGDRVQENNALDACAQRMDEYFHIDYSTDSKAILRMGRENWPFPIPLVKSGDSWFFDTVAGRDEILNRRIGENELNAIGVCRAYVEAQKEYAQKVHAKDGVVQYAQHFMSRPGTHDGLYWDVKPGEDLSPMGPLVAQARMDGYPATQPSNGKIHPYKGYVFHILTAQGPAAPGGKMSYIVDGKMTKGFALVAMPSEYGASGIMTFTVDKDGKVYQKNIQANGMAVLKTMTGRDTTRPSAAAQSTPGWRQAVEAMTEYNPDKTWEETKD